MKYKFLYITFLLSALFFSCKKEEGVSCLTCTSPDTESFELCRESDGTASVNGENTGTPYDVYYSGLQDINVQCGQ